MLQAFKAYIVSEKLFSPKERILLAVSGGRDSVAMTHLFHLSGFRFGIAHCNFQLRGEESDKDKLFVESLAKKYNVPFFSTTFNISKYINKKGVSIQMAARELRYAWFNEILKDENFDLVATAHHLDDQIETFFINLLRSSGIAGFHGIPVKNGKVIRPMLFSYRKDIDDFININHLAYREDSSNLETKYLRNRIRIEVLPVLKDINPDFHRVLTENIDRVADAEKIFEEAIRKKMHKMISKDDDHFVISIHEMKKLTPLLTYLYEFLSPYGFNYTVITELMKVLDEGASKKFYSSTHLLIKDRKQLIISRLKISEEMKEKCEYLIDEKKSLIQKPVKLSFKKIKKDKTFSINTGKNFANLDSLRITYPLVLRKWKKGDHFQPFGRGQKKKLSDFFIDQKFSLLEKENTWLLCSGDKIIWVIGHRIDNRFRITQRTQDVLLVEWHK
jgi:tRNA(Ile)-lysidine synthase